MEKYLNKNIKEIIERYPETSRVLEEFNILCVNCNLATCLLKDVIEIHNLSEEDERKLFEKIGKIIYGKREFKIPKLERKIKKEKINFSPPIRILVDEHVLIKECISLIPDILKDCKIEILHKITDFIRNFADRFHHAKEEDYLFKYFDQNIEIINVMKSDHEKARNLIKNVISGIEDKNFDKIRENFSQYIELLNEHIKKEDEVLYPWMDRNLSISEVGQIFSKFKEIEKEFGGDFYEKYKKEIENIKRREI